MLGRASRLAVLAGLLVAAVPASAASQEVRSYRVADVSDLLDRSAVQLAGAAIVEVNHAEVVVTPTGAPSGASAGSASMSRGWRLRSAWARRPPTFCGCACSRTGR